MDKKGSGCSLTVVPIWVLLLFLCLFLKLCIHLSLFSWSNLLTNHNELPLCVKGASPTNLTNFNWNFSQQLRANVSSMSQFRFSFAKENVKNFSFVSTKSSPNQTRGQFRSKYRTDDCGGVSSRCRRDLNFINHNSGRRQSNTTKARLKAAVTTDSIHLSIHPSVFWSSFNPV